MIKKLKNLAVILISILALMAPSLMFAGESYAANGCNNNVVSAINSGINATHSNTGGAACGTSGVQTGIKKVVGLVISVFSYVVGAISVIMIIYAGFRYVTSGGNSEGTTGARNTLIFAVIGLVVAILAQLVVHLVLNSAANINS